MGKTRGALYEVRPELKAHGLFYSDAPLRLPIPTWEEKKRARKILGKDQYPLFHAVRSGPRNRRIWARNRLFEIHKGLVGTAITKGHWTRFIRKGRDKAKTLDDLQSVGYEGLLHAIEAFDYARGYRFSTYAVVAIYRRITRDMFSYIDNIHIPVQLREATVKYSRLREEFYKAHGRMPEPDEIKMLLGSEDEKRLDLIEAVECFHFSGASRHLRRGSGDNGSDSEFDIWDTLNPHVDLRIDQAYQPERDAYLEAVVGGWLSRIPITSEERRILESLFELRGQVEKTIGELATELGVGRYKVKQLRMRALTKLAEHVPREIEEECLA